MTLDVDVFWFISVIMLDALSEDAVSASFRSEDSPEVASPNVRTCTQRDSLGILARHVPLVDRDHLGRHTRHAPGSVSACSAFCCMRK